MFCTKCGNKLPDGAKFCTSCGAKVLSQQTTVGTEEKGAFKAKSGLKWWMIAIPVAIVILLIIAAVVLGSKVISGIRANVQSLTQDEAYDFYEEDISGEIEEELNEMYEELQESLSEDGLWEDELGEGNQEEEIGNSKYDAAGIQKDREDDEEYSKDRPKYTNDEMVELAEKYYYANGGSPGIPNLTFEIDGIDEDIVTIHVYELTPDHWATIDWYNVSNVTGLGKDFFGNPVDFNDLEYIDLDDYRMRSYILPYTEYYELTEEDLWDLSEEELRIARNEIYARHGRKFKDKRLQEYFDSMPWYEGIYEPEEFTDAMLNDIEIYNKNFIADYEKYMGYNQ